MYYTFILYLNFRFSVFLSFPERKSKIIGTNSERILLLFKENRARITLEKIEILLLWYLCKYTTDERHRGERTNGNKPIITGRGRVEITSAFCFPSFRSPFPRPPHPPHSNVKLSGLIFRLCRAPQWPPAGSLFASSDHCF